MSDQPRTQAGRDMLANHGYRRPVSAEWIRAIEDEARAGVVDPSDCPMCGEWRDSPTSDCAACGETRTAAQIDDDLEAMASGNFV